MALAPISAGAESDRRWSLGVDAVVMSPAGNEAAATLDGEAVTFGVSDGDGFGLRLGYQATRRFGLGLAIRRVDLDTELRLATPGGSRTEHGSMELEMYRLTADYRFVLRDRWSLFAGGIVGMSKGSDQVFATQGGQSKLTFDDDFGFGAVFGFERSLGATARWRLRAEAAYLKTILETDSGLSDLDLDPASLSLGLALRF